MHPWIQPFASALGFNPVGWVRNTRRMQADVSAFLQQYAATGGQGPRILAVITPWQGTSVPWYTLALALLLHARGCRISFVLDDFRFGDKPWRYAFVLRCLRAMLRSLQERFEVVTLSSLAQPSDVGSGHAPMVHALAQMNTTWQLRGEMLATGRQAYVDQCLVQIGRADRPIARLLDGGRYDVVLVPGGVFGTSGLWVAHARARSLRTCSFDAGGYGVAMFATNGVASHLSDIPEAFGRLKAHGSPAEHAFAHDAALVEMGKRRQGVDAFSSQIARAGGGDARHDGAVLIALNSSWDAAALGLHTVFQDNSTWIVETVRHVLAKTPANVIVRQHPVERLPMGWTSDDYRELLQRHFGDEPRLHFIAATDSINSYALLARVCMVVTYTSTIGIEAAALGKPVVSPSRAYYTGLGFVRKAEDLSGYEALLSAGAAGQLSVSAQMRADAHLCYYLTQCCNWFFSPFNPSDFAIWSRLGLAALHTDDRIQVAVRALADGIPLAYLNHRQRLADASPSPVSSNAHAAKTLATP
jgi:hypothetical protein